MVSRDRGPNGTFLPKVSSEAMTPDERRARDRELKRIKREQNRDEFRQKNREWNFRRKYGITVAQYDEMRIMQGYRCAICKSHEDEIVRQRGRKTTDGIQVLNAALVVDHCHRSNQVRKLLCYRCNQMIGHAREDSRILAAGIDYLWETRPETP